MCGVAVVQMISHPYIKKYVSIERLHKKLLSNASLSGEPDYFGRNKISSGGDLSHYSSASLY